ncbi:hypothetical protein BD779DRAFT_1466170 [Infundibulicybe gibba]|nr:hypothetical protein BD779DRAFT_1466170 [Infundibulicybe gibba]
MAPVLEDLPAELLNKVCQTADHPDLLALRLASHKISTHATQWAFHRVVVGFDEESTGHMNHILDDPSLCNWVHHFCFDTGRDGYSFYSDIEGEEADVSEELELALSASGTSAICDPSRCDFAANPESAGFRAEVLGLVINALDDPTHPTPNFHALSIKGLQDHNDRVITTSPAFRAVLARVRILKLLIISEATTAAPERSISLPELHAFFQQLPKRWLRPPAIQLSTLHLLSHTENFGFCPRLDLRGTHFPALRVLALGNYTFTHDWQFEWIQAHGSTLRTLIMDSCPIIYNMRFSAPDVEGYPSDPKMDWGDYVTRTYEKSWAEFFHVLEFEEAFPQLREFRFGASDAWDDSCEAFEQLEALVPRVYREMYMAFDRGIGPSQWIEEAEEDGAAERPNYEEDKDAFEDLQEVLRRRRGEGI